MCSLVSIYFDSTNLQYSENKLYKPVDYLIHGYTQFRIFRKGSGKSFFTTFCVSFSKGNVLMFYSTNWPNFIVWLPLLHEILGNMYIVIACFPCCNVRNFAINLSSQAAFLHGQEVRTKILISWERKELLRRNKKHFSSVLRAFSCQKLSQT